ncbi:MAG: conjugal transfer protein TraF [Gammaproteobacteria bacterium]
MKVIKSGFCAVALVLSSQSVMAAPFAYEARSLGMGNIGVATADIATAPFMNPAMLSFQKSDDDFSLLLAAGAFFSDNNGMIDNIDQFQVVSAAYDAAVIANDIPAQLAAATDMLAITQQLDGKALAPEATAGVVIGMAGEVYSMAVSARSDVIIAGGLTNVAINIVDVVDPAFNVLTIAGVKTSEVGLSIARSFEIMDSKISIGVTPKTVNVEALSHSESITTSNTDASSLLDQGVQDLGDFTTMDLGIVIGLTNHIQLGVMAKNLIEEEMTFLTTTGGIATVTFDTQLKAGLAYSNEFITIGADLDLTENASIISGGLSGGLIKKNMSLGMEIDVFDIAQLRVGMVKNVANGISVEAQQPLYTAGVGLWLGFNLDIAAIKGEGDSAGAFVQAGFKF